MTCFRVGLVHKAICDLSKPLKVYKCNFVYFILLLHGIGILMPWNMFITAKSYFEDHKLKSDDEITKHYQSKFMLYITLASQIPNLLFNFLNVFIKLGGDLTSRIVISILVEIVIFIATVVLAMVDSQTCKGNLFFWLTIASVVFLNMANGIYQNSVYGIAGKLPMKYTNAVVLGSNVSGTIVSLISIAAIAIAPNARTSAIYYFISALFVLLACFDTYFALPLSRFYRYYEQQSEKQNQTTYKSSLSYRIPYWTIFKKAFPQLWNVFFTFFVTLLIFPSLHSNIKMSDPNFVIPGKYYTAVMCFLVFNFFSMVGNILPFMCRANEANLDLAADFTSFFTSPRIYIFELSSEQRCCSDSAGSNMQRLGALWSGDYCGSNRRLFCKFGYDVHLKHP
uniref:Battenin n=1 Tax=Strigamia maritima TaxID=126957 RepID=T1IMY7_STRMM